MQVQTSIDNATFVCKKCNKYFFPADKKVPVCYWCETPNTALIGRQVTDHSRVKKRSNRSSTNTNLNLVGAIRTISQDFKGKYN